MLWRDTLPMAGAGSLSASSSCEALITGAQVPTISPPGEQVQAVRNHAVLRKRQREVSADWRRRAEVQGRPYACADPQPERTAGARGRDSFSASPAQSRPRRSSLARLVTGTARRPGKSAATSSPSESSEESDQASSPDRRSPQRPDNANPFLLYDTDEEETDEHGRLVVHFPATNVAPEPEVPTFETKPKRRLSDIWKGLLLR